MKLEIEIDDNIYRVLNDLFEGKVDIGSLLGDTCQAIAVLMVTRPEDFVKAYGDEARVELPESIQSAIKRISDKYIKKARGCGDGKEA